MAASAASFLLRHIAAASKSLTHSPFRNTKPYFLSPSPIARFLSSSLPIPYQSSLDNLEDKQTLNIPVKAYFLSTSINLKNFEAENSSNVLPQSARSSNSVALQFSNLNPEITGTGLHSNASSFSYLVAFQYGSAVLFNIRDHEVENYLELVRKHSCGLLQPMRTDDYAVKENPRLVEDMQRGPDCIVLKSLDPDTICIIGSVLGQSIALDYFASKFNDLVEEFAEINRGMEKTGTFYMDKKKLVRFVGKANSNYADVILKVGLFDRSEIAWRDAKYAEIYEYLREEYEMAQRIEILNFKLKFVEHNIVFLQKVLQNRKSNFLEWCIIGLLALDLLYPCMRLFVIQFVSA